MSAPTAILRLGPALLLAVCLAPTDVQAQAVVETLPDRSEGQQLFEYQLEGRPDPFVPFISEEAANPSPRPDEIIDPQQQLHGMQLFEPGQLTLVAIISQGGRPLAMVEDFTGKGYLLREGIKVGKRGRVKAISERRVVIEETALTRTGKKIQSEFIMQLKNEGE